MITGILFDKDGTLIEFHATQHSIYAAVLAHLKDDYQVAPPQSHLGMARYENAMNFFGRDTGDRVLEAARTALDRTE